MECSFTLRHYRDTLELAKTKGYVFSRMKDYHENIHHSKVIFMRHDADIQVRNALRLAGIEAELEIPATYFFRVHASYNLFSLEHYRTIKRILELGHEAGLHYEADFAELVNEQDKDMFQREKQMLELITGEKVLGMTQHEFARRSRPFNEKSLHELDLEYMGYSSQFFTDIKYISDSGGRWREGCMCKFIENDTPKLCILTHPVWWYDKSPIENY